MVDVAFDGEVKQSFVDRILSIGRGHESPTPAQQYHGLSNLSSDSAVLVVSLYMQFILTNLICGRVHVTGKHLESMERLIAAAESCHAEFKFESCVSSAKFPSDNILVFASLKKDLLDICNRSLISKAGLVQVGPGSELQGREPSAKLEEEVAPVTAMSFSSVDNFMSLRSRDTPKGRKNQVANAFETRQYSKFISSATVNVSQGISFASIGCFTSALFAVGKAANTLNLDADDIGASLRQYVLLNHAWLAYLAGNCEQSRVMCASVIDFTRVSKQVTVCRWALELQMLQVVLSSSSGASVTSSLDSQLTEIKRMTKSDKYSACTATVLGLALALDKDKKSLSMCRYAVSKLRCRVAVTLVPGIFLFIGGYAATLLLESHGVDGAKDGRSLRFIENCKDVVQQSILGLTDMESTQPCLRLLRDALQLKYLRATSQEISVTYIVSNTSASDYNEFLFGNTFFLLEKGDQSVNQDATFRTKVVSYLDHLAKYRSQNLIDYDVAL
jgi:hypothetical protein